MLPVGVWPSPSCLSYVAHISRLRLRTTMFLPSSLSFVAHVDMPKWSVPSVCSTPATLARGSPK